MQQLLDNPTFIPVVVSILFGVVSYFIFATRIGSALYPKHPKGPKGGKRADVQNEDAA